jgi:hypothetical protein
MHEGMEAGRALSLRDPTSLVPRHALPGAAVTAHLAIAAFFLLDAGFVVLGLCLLHRQRCIADITDLRYRDHPDRARRTLGH